MTHADIERRVSALAPIVDAINEHRRGRGEAPILGPDAAPLVHPFDGGDPRGTHDGPASWRALEAAR